jgi:hypothetical protein
MEEQDADRVPSDEPTPARPARRATPIVDGELLAELQELKNRGTPVYNNGDETVRLLAVLLVPHQAMFAPSVW